MHKFFERRMELAHEYDRIARVRHESERLVSELNLRRDGIAPSRLDLPELRRALMEVDYQMNSSGGPG